MTTSRTPSVDPTQTAAPAAADYVLGTDDEELARLGLQHHLWRAQALALWERAGFAPGQTLLDLGSGPGFATLDLALTAGSTGHVVAVDGSARYLEHLGRLRAERWPAGAAELTRHQVELNAPGALAAVATGSVDGVYARWVLCFLRDPDGAVAEAARVLRPGGALVVQDYVNYLSLTLTPHGKALERVARAVAASWARHGGQVDVGRVLPGLLRRHGLWVEHTAPLLRMARPGSALWQWPTTFFRLFVPQLVRMGLLTEEDALAFREEWDAASRDPDACFLTPLMLDIVARKPR